MEDEQRRSTAARIGIAALNFLGPGLGLIRVGRGRAGLAWLMLSTALLASIPLVYAVAPAPSFLGYAIGAAILLFSSLACLVIATMQSWRASRPKGEPTLWWMRWYALLGLWLLLALLDNRIVDLAHSFYKPFYAAAESMTPTISKNDRLLVDMRPIGHIARGQVLIFGVSDQLRISRIVGMPGDRIAIRNGIPLINGRAVLQRPAGKIRYEDGQGLVTARRIEERFPGEAGSHFILDQGHVPMTDEMPEKQVPPDRFFILGDNRDRSADSRVSVLQNGSGLPGRAAVRGRPLFFYWSDDRAKVGKPIGG